MLLLALLIGALFRRYWGGFVAHWGKGAIKRILGFVIGFVAAFAVTGNLIAASIIGGLILAIWLAPFGLHAKGHQMQNGTDPQGREHTIVGDFINLWLCYVPVMILIAGVLIFFTGGGLIYPFLGLLIPVAYYVARVYQDKLPKIILFKSAFIDGHTTIGELALGAIVIGGLFI